MTIAEAGTILTLVLGFLSILGYFRRIEKKMDFYLIEHEMLMADYAARIGVQLHQLPTRTRGIRP